MAHDPPFEVLPYSIETLKGLFARIAKSTIEAVSSKTHLAFFGGNADNVGYFDHDDIAAKTIVVEYDYIDHDYLEDFAAYYVRCFEDYSRKCTRLHFFDRDFSKAALESLIGGDENALSAEQLRASYIGFVVTKPLPHCFIGRTCLKTYADDGNRRHYKNVRICESSLFGIPLTVKSLAFQEQDQVVAACATSALWSAFHATSNLFGHSFPSPVEITRQATEHTPVQSRVFPHTDGLDGEQMAHAIRDVGLEPLYIQGDPDDQEEPGNTIVTPRVLRSSVYAYLSFGIPVILLIKLADSNLNLIGNHACTVTGFSLGANPQLGETRTLLCSDKIDKLYVHDDQVGPFARMTLIEDPNLFHLDTSWGLPDMTDVLAVPFALLIPLYNKIRIPFSEAVKLVKSLDRGLTLLRAMLPLDKKRPVWDVRLTDINEVKQGVASAAHLDSARKQALRLKDLPRYMWRATASTESGVQADMLIDATDINHGKFIRWFHVTEKPLREFLALAQHKSDADMLASPTTQGSQAAQSAIRGLMHFLRRLNSPLLP